MQQQIMHDRAEFPAPTSHITYHQDLIQGSEEWHAARLGLLTASEMKHIITPKTLLTANNDKTKAHLYEMVAQRLTGFVDPHYVSEDMLRGIGDEMDAKILYAEKHLLDINDLTSVGFITNNRWGFTIGYSPDGLVCHDGSIECKSRRPRLQVETILSGEMPNDYLIQVQTGLLVSERSWCDFISYSGGLPMMVLRIHPDEAVQDAIVNAASVAEVRITEMLEQYHAQLKATHARFTPTVRKIEQPLETGEFE